MANTIQIRRGSKAALSTLALARFGFTTDTYQLYIGKGAENIPIALNRFTSIASSATPTPNCDTDDVYIITALAVDATFGAPTGTPVNGQKLIIRITDDGVGRALSWNAIYRAGAVALPNTTEGLVTLYCGFIYNAGDDKWDFLGSDISAHAASTTGVHGVVAGIMEAAEYALTYAANIEINWNNGSTQYVVLTGNTTFTFVNPVNGQVYRIRVTQDATGSRTVTWPTITWAGGSVPTLTTTANKSDIITLLYSNGAYYADCVNNF